MLPIAFILMLAAGSIVVLGVLINQKSQQRLSEVRSWADAKVDAMVKAAYELDQNLGKQLCEGQSFSEAIAVWQTERTRIGPPGHADRPFAWDAERVERHRDELIEQKSGEIVRRTIARMVIAIAAVTVAAGTIILVYYQFYSRSALDVSLPADSGAAQPPPDAADSTDSFDWDAALPQPPAAAPPGDAPSPGDSPQPSPSSAAHPTLTPNPNSSPAPEAAGTTNPPPSAGSDSKSPPTPPTSPSSSTPDSSPSPSPSQTPAPAGKAPAPPSPSPNSSQKESQAQARGPLADRGNSNPVTARKTGD